MKGLICIWPLGGSVGGVVGEKEGEGKWKQSLRGFFFFLVLRVFFFLNIKFLHYRHPPILHSEGWRGKEVRKYEDAAFGGPVLTNHPTALGNRNGGLPWSSNSRQNRLAKTSPSQSFSTTWQEGRKRPLLRVQRGKPSSALSAWCCRN
jgi:hypothetical protein